jgi:hypothetical protein
LLGLTDLYEELVDDVGVVGTVALVVWPGLVSEVADGFECV